MSGVNIDSVVILMLSLIGSAIRSLTSSDSALLSELEQEHHRHESYFKEIDNLRTLQTNYHNRLVLIINSLREKSVKPQSNNQSNPNSDSFCAGTELMRVLERVAEVHFDLLEKLNSDVGSVSVDAGHRMLQEGRKLLDEGSKIHKQLVSKREAVQKVLAKKDKLRKQKEEEMMLQIFMEDSVENNLDKKIRKQNKIKQLEKECEEWEIKVTDTIQQFKTLQQRRLQFAERAKENHLKTNRVKLETLLKTELHLALYWKNAVREVEEQQAGQAHVKDEQLHLKWEGEESAAAEIIGVGEGSGYGFVDSSLKIINDGSIDEIIEYSRNNEVRSRIKRMMESNEVAPPQETDQASRQVRIVRKMLEGEVEEGPLGVFRGMLRKSWKMRMNFVFMMQFYRLNNQFEISIDLMRRLYCILCAFISACYDNGDCFALKQLVVLLLTYYVTHPRPQPQEPADKIYIVHFFKQYQLWQDLQFWESALLQSIYIQKRNTRKMMLLQPGNVHRKKELLEAERLAILNQMLMVVRNMVIFEWPTKMVKTFAARFVKLLKQDDQMQKDLNNTIEEAGKEQSKGDQLLRQAIRGYYKCHLCRQQTHNQSPNSPSTPLPTDIRKSFMQ